LAELGFTDSDCYSKDLSVTTFSKELAQQKKDKGELTLSSLSFKKHIPSLSSESIERISQKYGLRIDQIKRALEKLRESVAGAKTKATLISFVSENMTTTNSQFHRTTFVK
jgi:DNA-directed RNA polymerase alpha subunit